MSYNKNVFWFLNCYLTLIEQKEKFVKKKVRAKYLFSSFLEIFWHRLTAKHNQKRSRNIVKPQLKSLINHELSLLWCHLQLRDLLHRERLPAQEQLLV